MSSALVDRLKTLRITRPNETWEIGVVDLARLGFGDVARAGSPPTLTAICASVDEEGAAIVPPPEGALAPEDDLALRAVVSCALEPHFPGARPWNRLPRRVHVAAMPPGMKRVLEDALTPLGVMIEVKPKLETVDSICEMTGMMRELQEETGEMPDVPPLMEVPGMTLDRVRAFAAGAVEFYKAKPWTERDTPELWQIMPEPPFPALRYCSLMGDMGECFGVAFHPSPDAYLEMTDQAALGGPASAIQELKDIRWAATLDDGESVNIDDAALWERERLPAVRRPKLIPAVIGVQAGPVFLRPAPEMLTFMEAVFRAFADASRDELHQGLIEANVPTADGPRRLRLVGVILDDADLPDETLL